MKNKRQLTAVVFLGFSACFFGQIREEKLILDKKREPEVRKIEKKKTSAEIVKNYPPQNKKTEDSLNLKYEITDIPAVSDFKTSTLASTDISPKFSSNFQKNYLRLGAGNYGKILADAFLVHNFSESNDAGIDFHYNSTTGLKKDYDWKSDQQNLDAAVFVNGYQEKGKYNLTANFGSNSYNYYGIYAMSPGSDADLKQQVNKFGLKGFYEFHDLPILERINVNVGFLNDHFDTKENSVLAQAILNKEFELKKFEGVKLGFEGDLEFKSLNTKFGILDKNEANHFIFEFDPKIKLKKGENFIAIGANMNYISQKNMALSEEEKDESDFSIMPQIEAQYAVRPDFVLYGSLDGGVELNSFSQLLQKNPYLVSNQILKPTDTKMKVTLGVKGDVNPSLKYDISASYANLENIVMFRQNELFAEIGENREAYDWLNTYSAEYEEGTKTEIKGALEFFPIENLELGTELSYVKYDLDNGEKMLNSPVFKSRISAKYTMLGDKLRLGFTGIFGSSGTANVFAVQDSPVYSLTENHATVDGFADINLSAEYQFHKNFSIFALGNNLANTKYQNYYGYKNLGAQFLGGIRFSF